MQMQPVTDREFLELDGEIFGLRNHCAIEQYWNDRDVAKQCGRDLDADEIIRIVEPTMAVVVEHIGPVRANDREQRVALGNFVAQNLDEIHPERHGVNVHEKEIGAKLSLQPVTHAPGMTCAVIAAIAYEQFAAHEVPSCRPDTITFRLRTGRHAAS